MTTTTTKKRMTVADVDTKVNNLDAKLDQLISVVTTIVQQQQAKPAKQAEEKPLIAPCPDYATPEQRIEYDKLAKRALKQRDAVAAAMGTESVRAFIPVSKTQSAMPHSIKWTGYYSK